MLHFDKLSAGSGVCPLRYASHSQREELGHLLEIVLEAGHHLAGLVTVEEGHRQRLKVVAEGES